MYFLCIDHRRKSNNNGKHVDFAKINANMFSQVIMTANQDICVSLMLSISALLDH